MNRSLTSPRITGLSWGHVKVENGNAHRDAKLYPGGSREWNWRETGTRHTPGIQFADVQELLDHGARVVILSRGMNQQLQVEPGTVKRLKALGIEYHILQTEDAVKKYNDMCEHLPVGGLFHSTC